MSGPGFERLLDAALAETNSSPWFDHVAEVNRLMLEGEFRTRDLVLLRAAIAILCLRNLERASFHSIAAAMKRDRSTVYNMITRVAPRHTDVLTPFVAAVEARLERRSHMARAETHAGVPFQ